MGRFFGRQKVGSSLYGIVEREQEIGRYLWYSRRTTSMEKGVVTRKINGKAESPFLVFAVSPEKSIHSGSSGSPTLSLDCVRTYRICDACGKSECLAAKVGGDDGTSFRPPCFLASRGSIRR